MFRSRDGGVTWEQLKLDIAAECSIGVPFEFRMDGDAVRVVFHVQHREKNHLFEFGDRLRFDAHDGDVRPTLLA